jgi:hypothetical protein
MRTSAGKLTLENRRGVDDDVFIQAMTEALATIRARLEDRSEAA